VLHGPARSAFLTRKELKLRAKTPTSSGVRRLLAPSLCALFALALAAPAAAQDFVPGELVVRFKASADPAERAEALARRRAALRSNLRLPNVSLVRLQQGDSVPAAAAALARDPAVLYAEPNYVYRTSLTPNDPGFPDTWGLTAISAPAAWDTTTGSPSVTVAVVDTGMSAGHPDLAPNLWTNPDETANGADDDGNGKIDDLHGWDFVTPGDANPDDDNGHGTHVAGTIGARGNDGYGVPGVAWNVKLMPLKAANASGSLDSAGIANAFSYACGEGARIVNGSFGGPGFSGTVKTAIDSCPAVLFVFAAGNEGNNDDASPRYPCAYTSANILCVAATDDLDALASFSNYGPVSVDLAAPGVEIVSTIPGDDWEWYSGTSMASPHVAGAAALVASNKTSLSAVELKAALLNGVDPVPALSGFVGSAGRLNVNAALTASTTPPGAPPPPPPPPSPGDTTAPTDPAVASTSHVVGRPSIDATVDMAWSGAFDYGSGVDGFSFQWDHAAATVPDAVKDAEESVGSATSPPLAPGTYWFHLRTRDNAGNWTAGTHVGPFVIATAAIPQPQRCIVPRLRGKTVRAAATVLKRAGCKLGPVKRARSRLKKGRIVAQRPAAGRKVGKGTPVVVTVSRGLR
jgi:subtilisin family serine protease